MKPFYPCVSKALAPHLDLPLTEIEPLLTAPPDPSLGDIAFPCFALSKAWRMAPQAIARDLAAKVSIASPIAQVTASGPYVNFHLDRPGAGAMILDQILAAGENWGGSRAGQGQTVCVDFCSPNVARRMHLGHLRSTVIGKSLVRLHQALGYEVVRINFLGDWGTQFGKLIAAWKRWGDPVAAEVDAIAELQRLYVRFHHASQDDPALVDEGRTWFKRLEDGDEEARALWTWIRAKSLACMESSLSQLDVSFDDYHGEAFYEDHNKRVVEMLSQQGLLVESDGAQVIPLDSDGMPPCLILKSDGATLYETRDLAAAIHRQESYHPARSLYVVDLGQSLHFRQVFAVLHRMGFNWAPTLKHVGFGVMKVGGKRLRTRAGDVVYLDDVLAQATQAAQAELESRSPGMEGAAEVARAIGVGAVIFNDLKQQRQKDVDFDPAEAIDFDGETGPYVQYAHARCVSLLRKAGDEPVRAAVTACLQGDPEWALLSAMADFPESVQAAAERCEPHLVARSVLDVAKALNRFYHDCPILRADLETREARLALVATAAITLRRGLWVLGLAAPAMRGN